MNVPELLTVIGELGFVDIRGNGSIYITPPALGIHKQRLDVLANFLFTLKQRRPDVTFTGFFTLFDAWRDHAEPSLNPEYFRPDKISLQQFVGRGAYGESGKFVQPLYLKDRFPLFDHPILSFGRHRNDAAVILIPDTDFAGTDGYRNLREEVDRDDRPWSEKSGKLFWRGSMSGFPYQVYDLLQRRSQRALLVEWAGEHHGICDAEVAKDVSRREQLGYKYLMDVDGNANDWSGLFWKLYSNSVVFKVCSHFEQWYYARIKPWVHYVPVMQDLSDLEEKFRWALDHDDECLRIARSGREFAELMTFDNELSRLCLTADDKDPHSCYAVQKNVRFTVPHLHNLTVVHTYQPMCTTVQHPPGLGDFLRGSIALHQLSAKYGFRLQIDFSSHPLHRFLKQNESTFCRKDQAVYEFFNEKNSELESFIVGQSGMESLRVTTHVVPAKQMTTKCRQFIRKNLKPTKAVTDYTKNVLASLGLKSYCVVHLRMGDHLFDTEIALPPALEAYFIEEILPVWGRSVLVVSDNQTIKHVLRDRFDVRILDAKPVHLGRPATSETSYWDVRDTFVEFLLMGASSWIYQYSVYPWGSSFSKICADIYGIPFERLTFTNC